MENGRLRSHGNVAEIISTYHALSAPDHTCLSIADMPRSGLGNARFEGMAITPSPDTARLPKSSAQRPDFTIELDLTCYAETIQATVAVIIYDSSGFRLIDVNTSLKGQYLTLLPGQRASVKFELVDLMLRPGEYLIGLWVGRHGIEDYDAIEFAGTLTINENTSIGARPEAYPGPYTCEFDISISGQREVFIAGGAEHVGAST
jgi:hypothetical protein